jgi:hypothetical protein
MPNAFGPLVTVALQLVRNGKFDLAADVGAKSEDPKFVAAAIAVMNRPKKPGTAETFAIVGDGTLKTVLPKTLPNFTSAAIWLPDGSFTPEVQTGASRVREADVRRRPRGRV